MCISQRVCDKHGDTALKLHLVCAPRESQKTLRKHRLVLLAVGEWGLKPSWMSRRRVDGVEQL